MMTTQATTTEVTNEEFLKVIFGKDWEQAHVTAFHADPSGKEVSSDGRKYWAGGSAKNRVAKFDPDANQYYCISLFHLNEKKERRRQKAYHDATFVIVADDVFEKLLKEGVEKLPPPTYKLLTSIGSEQWGWVLDEPCADRKMVENLLDGLVEKGLAPNGKDPGMKGVTRYVRLPGGSNTKKSKMDLNGGKPHKCRMYEWNPSRMYAIEDLARVFNIDLNAARHDEFGKLAEIDDWVVREHPLVKRLGVLGKTNDGGIRLAHCVNAKEHSDGNPEGAAIYVRPDGTFGYKCHHGHCNGDKKSAITGLNAVEVLDMNLEANGAIEAEVGAYLGAVLMKGSDALNAKLGKSVVVSSDSQAGGTTTRIERRGLGDRFIFMPDRSKFYDAEDHVTMSGSDLDKMFGRVMKHPNTASRVIIEGSELGYDKVHGLGWYPSSIFPPNRASGDLIFEHAGQFFVNTWRGLAITPVQGDVSIWLDHVNFMLPDQKEREAVLDWLAFVVQRLDEKPSYSIVHRGTHGVGKDTLFRPLFDALGKSSGQAKMNEVIPSGSKDPWGDHLIEKRLLMIEEVDASDRSDAANKLKTLIAPYAAKFRELNKKGSGFVRQVDVLCCILATNKRNFMRIEPTERRYFVVDSWQQPKDHTYYDQILTWYDKDHGSQKVLAWLLARDISGKSFSKMPFEPAGTIELKQNSKANFEEKLEALMEDELEPFNKPFLKASDVSSLATALHCNVSTLVEALAMRGWHKFDKVQVTVDKVHIKAKVFYTDRLDKKVKNAEAYEFYKKYFG